MIKCEKWNYIGKNVISCRRQVTREIIKRSSHSSMNLFVNHFFFFFLFFSVIHFSCCWCLSIGLRDVTKTNSISAIAVTETSAAVAFCVDFAFHFANRIMMSLKAKWGTGGRAVGPGVKMRKIHLGWSIVHKGTTKSCHKNVRGISD